MVVQSEENLRLYALGALFWLAFVAFILTGLFTTIREAPFIAIPFFGVFLWLAWKGAVLGLRSFGAYVNFGTVQLALEGAPAAGGALKGAVQFERGAAALAKFDAELLCTREFHSTKSSRNRPEPEVLFSAKAPLEVHVEPGNRRAPFAFALPADARPSGEDEGNEQSDHPPTIRWMLRLRAPHAGGDLARSFELQVLPAGTLAAEVSQAPSAVAALALVAANLMPLALVLAGRQDVGGLVVLYWAENVVIGGYTVLRMLEAGRGSAADKVGQTLFFCVHYGIFCLVHGIFVAAMFLPREQLHAIQALAPWPGPLFLVQGLFLGAKAMGLFSPGALLLPLLALAASHGVSFYQHYLRNGRYLSARPQDSFWRPYPRMILLHLAIIGGGFFIERHGSSVPLLAALVIGKTLIDLTLHRRSNRAR